MQPNLAVAGVIRAELLVAVASAPVLEPKDSYVKATLDKLFCHYDWTGTFSSPTIILYDEVITSEILVILHKWLRSKSSNIENIYLVTTCNSGICQWWKQWCNCFNEKSFNVVELFFTDSLYFKNYFKDVTQCPDLNFYTNNKKIVKLFSFYGGTYSSSEREFLTLSMLKFHNCASIDFFAQFSSKKTLLDYSENITYYLNQKEIDALSDLYDQYVKDGCFLLNQQYVRQKNESVNFGGLQWELDKFSWATVIRETINTDCFSTVTEKTVRACIHHTVLIPIGVRSVSDLETLGFWFPHDIVDYSYQHNPIFASRINQLCNSLKKITETYSMGQLHQYYLDNIHLFQYNAQLVFDLYKSKLTQS